MYCQILVFKAISAAVFGNKLGPIWWRWNAWLLLGFLLLFGCSNFPLVRAESGIRPKFHLGFTMRRRSVSNLWLKIQSKKSGHEPYVPELLAGGCLFLAMKKRSCKNQSGKWSRGDSATQVHGMHRPLPSFNMFFGDQICRWNKYR